MDSVIVACVSVAECRGFSEDGEVGDGFSHDSVLNVGGERGGGGGGEEEEEIRQEA